VTDSVPVEARDAATIMLVRDAEESRTLEVCMVRRHLDSGFVGGAYVFPGGKVDDEDLGPAAAQVCTGRTDAQASEILGLASGGLGFWVAALRECFEEAGVLLAYRGGGERHRPGEEASSPKDQEAPSPIGEELVDVADPAVRKRLEVMRIRLNAGEVEFPGACRAEGLSLAVDRVHYFSHWITPEPAPRRFDTRFFVAALPPDQVPVHDDHETVDTVWLRPTEALERARAGELDVMFPTIKNLQAIGRFDTSFELLSAAAAIERVPTVLPRVVADDRGFRILLPGDEGYEEATGERRLS